MPVLDPLHPLGIKSGALWLIEGDHRYACFLYAPSAHADHLRKFFEGRTLGSVMCDGSPTNNCVEQDAGGRRGGCNAHGRRGLVDALRRGDARAVEGLEIYAKIFHVDAESKRLGGTCVTPVRCFSAPAINCFATAATWPLLFFCIVAMIRFSFPRAASAVEHSRPIAGVPASTSLNR
jgi:hypothetical protein